MSGIDYRDTWTVKAVLRDGALGQRTERPNLVSRCSTKLGLPVLGTVPSVSGPIDQTWSTVAWDGALGQRTPSTELGLPVLGTVPSVSGPIDQTWSAGTWTVPLMCWVPEQPSGNSWDVYRTEKLIPKPADRDQHKSRSTTALNVNGVPRHSTQGHIRPCLQEYHGIPNRDNTAIPA